ncbi:DUF3396 domain-containing protein [Pyxidicoccus fallax]|uniref:DUF3396 domain-containing protein n=1 Tax=Pyxidicoccus fallax TaxID=394095 RepID=A0A848LXB3_9BACT|nr:type VI immunity family protein [Pyxidicoccus fallax]NMO22033.1 DUF3396 domain-containing protein [Pyxidicoccus fallax]NPC83536.1 DUF3396 domain-containing protein [Pyxidicoccus fallax]
MNDRYPRIRLYSEFEGERYLTIRDSVNITFYMRTAHRDVARSVLNALETYRRAIGPRLLGWYVDYAGDWQKLDDTGWSFVHDELLQMEGTQLKLAERPDARTGYEFGYQGRPFDLPDYDASPGELTSLSCWVPTEYLEEHGPARVRELAIELGARLPFQSGHAGLCFHFNEWLVGMTRHVRELCFEYPGLDISTWESTSTKLGARLKAVQWLTFLGPPVLQEVGGVSGLGSRLRSPETTVQALDGDRAVITLGSWPEAGTTEPERTLAPYRELARLLEPWLFLDRRRLRGFTPEDMRRWERRFLD